MSDSENEDDGINITLGKLIAYPIGLLLLLSGLAGLVQSFAAGVLLLLAGATALPIARSKLKNQTGVGINRWAASAIVLILMVSGGALLPSNSGSDGLDTGDNSELPETVDQPATELIPTIDDFESGWRGSVDEDGTASFSGPDGDQAVTYNVTVYSSPDQAQSALESANPENIATEDASFGNDGFTYQLGEDQYRTVFRDRNVVCDTTYIAGIGTFSPESNAEDHAEKCLNSIRG